RRFMPRPLVLLVELARGEQRRQLEVAAASDSLSQVLIQDVNRFCGDGAVHRDRRRSRFRHAAAATDEVPDALACGIKAVALERRETRKRLRVYVRRQP